MLQSKQLKKANALGTLLAIETGLLTSPNITDIAYIYDKLISSNFDGVSDDMEKGVCFPVANREAVTIDDSQ